MRFLSFISSCFRWRLLSSRPPRCFLSFRMCTGLRLCGTLTQDLTLQMWLGTDRPDGVMLAFSAQALSRSCICPRLRKCDCIGRRGTVQEKERRARDSDCEPGFKGPQIGHIRHQTLQRQSAVETTCLPGAEVFFDPRMGCFHALTATGFFSGPGSPATESFLGPANPLEFCF